MLSGPRSEGLCSNFVCQPDGLGVGEFLPTRSLVYPLRAATAAKASQTLECVWELSSRYRVPRQELKVLQLTSPLKIHVIPSMQQFAGNTNVKFKLSLSYDKPRTLSFTKMAHSSSDTRPPQSDSQVRIRTLWR